MRLLLDTHIALWAITDSRDLPQAARELITDTGNEIFVSAASLWEIAIKHALKRKGKDAMPVSADDAERYFRAAGYDFLPITPAHACAVGALPPHHADPFDRMLVAQALTEPFRLVTHDGRLTAYSDTIIRT